MYVCLGSACMHTCMCMHACVYDYLTHVNMYFWQSPPVLKLAALGLPPPPNIEKLPTPMNIYKMNRQIYKLYLSSRIEFHC